MEVVLAHDPRGRFTAAEALRELLPGRALTVAPEPRPSPSTFAFESVLGPPSASGSQAPAPTVAPPTPEPEPEPPAGPSNLLPAWFRFLIYLAAKPPAIVALVLVALMFGASGVGFAQAQALK